MANEREMSGMSAPAEKVDVLATLMRQIEHTKQFGGSPSFRTMQKAHDAVADLIDAARLAYAQAAMDEDAPLSHDAVMKLSYALSAMGEVP